MTRAKALTGYEALDHRSVSTVSTSITIPCRCFASCLYFGADYLLIKFLATVPISSFAETRMEHRSASLTLIIDALGTHRKAVYAIVADAHGEEWAPGCLP